MLVHYSFFALLSFAFLHSSLAEKIDYTTCQGTALIEGLTESVDISPCDRGADDEPCRFRFGHKYTITIDYTPLTSAEEPRASLQARDDYQDPSLRYAYSGQAFDACQYTECPVQGGKPSTYTYEFETLQSHFNHLTINATTGISGPSFLCVSFDALFMPAVAGRAIA